jgi:hypothetical protein
MFFFDNHFLFYCLMHSIVWIVCHYFLTCRLLIYFILLTTHILNKTFSYYCPDKKLFKMKVKIEEPTRMRSTVQKNSDSITISTPKRKSWVLIFFLSLFPIQFLNGIVVMTIFSGDLAAHFRILFCLIFATILYVIIRGIFWQLKGVNKIIISKDVVSLCAYSPMTKKVKIYQLSSIKSIEIKDESIEQGSMAMLQLLKITDKVKIYMTYGFDTIKVCGGIDMVEAIALKKVIKDGIGLN